MEPSLELYRPWRLYARLGWAASAGSLVSCGCGIYSHLAFIPAALSALTAVWLFWLAARPDLRVSRSHLNIGERTIVWQEILRIDHAFASPLVLKFGLTNQRRLMLVYPGEPAQIAVFVDSLRRNSYLATFDGVRYRDYHLWSSLSDAEAEQLGMDEPTPMISPDDEQEIERMYQRLKSVGHIDAAGSDEARTAGED